MPMTHALDAYALQMVEFVRVHEAWAAPLAFALAFGESLAFLSLLVPPMSAPMPLSAAGWQSQLLANLNCCRSRGRLGRLAVVLARNQDWSPACGILAPLAPSKTPTQCRNIPPSLGGPPSNREQYPRPKEGRTEIRELKPPVEERSRYCTRIV
jgi:hypothetical protein